MVKIPVKAVDENENSVHGGELIQLNDPDDDRIFNIDDCDKCPNTPAGDRPVDNEGCGPSERDSDGDGMPDFWEKQYEYCGLNYLDPSDGRICGSDTTYCRHYRYLHTSCASFLQDAYRSCHGAGRLWRLCLSDELWQRSRCFEDSRI